ncbi:MAG: hypothetical protein MUO77_02580 [Anaerolineales bacterium]|nr:hypothetical protein [Anaerolineales bacterium]
MDTLSGAVERITFYNSENGYTVLRLRPDSKLAHRFANKSSLSSDGLATVGAPQYLHITVFDFAITRAPGVRKNAE